MRFNGVVVFMVSPLLAILLTWLMEWLTGIHDHGFDSKGMGGFLTLLALYGGLGWLVTIPVGIIIQSRRRKILKHATSEENNAHL